jgi:hypothetical protein
MEKYPPKAFLYAPPAIQGTSFRWIFPVLQTACPTLDRPGRPAFGERFGGNLK